MKNKINHLENPSQRLQLFVDQLAMSGSKFEKETGNSVSSVVRFLRGESDISFKAIERIHARYPELNIDWLITGRGNMIHPPDADKLPIIADQLRRVYEAAQQLELSLFPHGLPKP